VLAIVFFYVYYLFSFFSVPPSLPPSLPPSFFLFLPFFTLTIPSHRTAPHRIACSIAILEFTEIMLCTWYLQCRHLSLILELFKIGAASKSNMGSYRVEMVVMWFDHIVDLHNFELVLMVLNAEEQASLYARIGKSCAGAAKTMHCTVLY
jgi:hypothetical protein